MNKNINRLYKWLLNKYFGFWFYFQLGRRPFDDYLGILTQVSNMVIIFVLLFKVDLNKYPVGLVVVVICISLFYVLFGKFYRWMGWQSEEDYLNAKLSPVQEEILGHLRKMSKHLDGKKKRNV